MSATEAAVATETAEQTAEEAEPAVQAEHMEDGKADVSLEERAQKIASLIDTDSDGNISLEEVVKLDKILEAYKQQ